MQAKLTAAINRLRTQVALQLWAEASDLPATSETVEKFVVTHSELIDERVNELLESLLTKHHE